MAPVEPSLRERERDRDRESNEVSGVCVLEIG